MKPEGYIANSQQNDEHLNDDNKENEETELSQSKQIINEHKQSFESKNI